MPKHHFKEGEEVYHKDNQALKLIVRRILKETKTFTKGFDEEKGEAIKEKGIRMIGIECHWWQKSSITGENEIQIHKFHSSELVPAPIVKNGPEEVNKWLRAQ